MDEASVVHRALQQAWHLAPEPVRRAVGRRIEFAVRRRVLGRPPTNVFARGPLVVSNYGDAPFGIGRAGRLTASALRAAGFDVQGHDIRPALDDHRIGQSTLPGAGGVWIAHCNPEHAAALMGAVARTDWANRYRIGYWAWELPRAPGFWLWMTRFFHEIWVPSDYVADALAGAQAPIRVMPHPVPLAAPAPHRDGPVRILTMADLRSAEARKNPIGAITAFRRAFAETQTRARLSVKLNGSSFDSAAFAQLCDAAARPDIALIDRILSDAQNDALFAESDVFVSLHRAEGFGLPIAEAMAHGAPALATNWSGNMDYMAGLDDLLVSYSMTPVRDASGVYRDKHALWAEPDLDAAARKLRRLVEDAPLRVRLGTEVRQRIAALHAPWSPEVLATAPWRQYIA